MAGLRLQASVSKRVKRLTRLGRSGSRGVVVPNQDGDRYQIIPIKEWSMDRVYDVYGRHHKLPALLTPTGVQGTDSIDTFHPLFGLITNHENKPVKNRPQRTTRISGETDAEKKGSAA